MNRDSTAVPVPRSQSAKWRAAGVTAAGDVKRHAVQGRDGRQRTGRWTSSRCGHRAARRPRERLARDVSRSKDAIGAAQHQCLDKVPDAGRLGTQSSAG